MAKTTASSTRYSAPAAACAADVLMALAEAEHLSLTEVRDSTGHTKSLIFRTLRELEERGYVQRDRNGHYSLGIVALELGAAYVLHVPFGALMRRELQRLSEQTGETTNLGILQGSSVLYLMQFRNRNSYVTVAGVGRTTPAASVALGKALLADLSTEQLRKILREPFDAMTPHSHASMETLLPDLAATRERGYARDQNEAVVGRAALAVTLPTVDQSSRQPTAISLSTTLERFEREGDDLVALLLGARDRIDREVRARVTIGDVDP